MSRLEDLVGDALAIHAQDAPPGLGVLEVVREREGRARRLRRVLATAGAAAVLVSAGVGVALARAWTPSPSVATATGRTNDTCPRLPSMFPSTLARPAASATTSVPSSTDATTPSNDPAAEALAQALGAQGHGRFADIYGSLLVDNPRGRVSLCVTDLARGHAMAQAAKAAAPDIDLSRLDLYRARYPQRTIDAVITRLAGPGGPRLAYPVYSWAFSPDASGIQVTTTVEGAASGAFHAALVTATGGVPVTLGVGGPVEPGDMTVTSPGHQSPGRVP
jgi:hypothetical protein